MLAAITQTEIIAWTVFGLLYLCALLWFVLVLLKGGPRPIRWRRFSVGVYVEKLRNGEERDDDDERRG